MINKKQLAIKLSKLLDYKNKKPSLEQYTTPSHIAATLLWHAYMEDNIENKKVCDMGCGNGILGIGALLLGAKKVTFVDVDERALDIVEENCKNLKLKNFKLENQNVVDVKAKFDTIVMNPPFGVQTKGLDLLFLKQSTRLAKKVYLIYKGDGLKIIKKELPNKNATLLEKTTLILKHQFRFHKKDKQETKIILAKLY